jgi:hypothetical protein
LGCADATTLGRHALQAWLFEIALVLKALKGWSPIMKPREEQDQLDAMRSELEADAPV